VVLDLHVDTLLWTRLLGYDMARRHRNRLPGAPFAWHFDLPRAAEGGLDAVVFGLVINPRTVHPELLGPLKALARLERSRGFEQTLATLGLLEEAARRHPDPLCFARSGSEVREAVSQGKLAGIAGLEGSHGIEGNLDNVRHAYERGLRLIGLVHFQRTEAAYPMTVAEFDDRGLTSFGRQLIGEMERLGMLVDLAHVNGAGIEDALAMLRQPYVVSHTACRALHDVPRNLSDEQIRSVAEHGGVVGMAFGRSFLGRPGLAGLLDHLEHAIRVGGADAVALGSDYDGAIVPATGLGDVTVLPRITAGLLARGQSHETVRKVMGENALRVLTEVCG
jgi:membrane dipeptidase